MEKLLVVLLQGSLVSIKIFCLTLLFSLPLGLPMAAARMSKNAFISWPARVFLLVIRLDYVYQYQKGNANET